MASEPSPFEGLGDSLPAPAGSPSPRRAKYPYRSRSEDPPDYVAQGFGIGAGLMMFGILVAFVIGMGCVGLLFFLAAAH